MRRFLLMLCFAVAMPLVATGCQAGEKGTRVAADASSRDAILNTKPKQVVKLHGRVPPSLRFEFRVWYTMTDVKAEGCRPRDATGGFLPMLGDFTRVEALAPRYMEGNRYEAELVVDKYLPGPCGWAFEEIKAVIVKDERVGDPLYTIETTTAVVSNNTHGKFEAYCDEFSQRSCDFRQNSDPTSVLLLCEITSSPWQGKPDFLACSDHYPGVGYKETHFLDAATSQIVLDFHDLNLEPSPISMKASPEKEATP
jgi:hypothetical protein